MEKDWDQWQLTVFNDDLEWYRVLGDDIDYLEHEKRRALEQGFNYIAKELKKCDEDAN